MGFVGSREIRDKGTLETFNLRNMHAGMRRSGLPGDESRSQVLAAVRNPLGFFTLALLIVEGIIGILSISNSPHLTLLAVIAALMFVFVVGVMALLLPRYTRELLAQSPAELREMQKVVGNMVESMRLSSRKKAFESAVSPESIVVVPPGTKMPVVRMGPRPQGRR